MASPSSVLKFPNVKPTGGGGHGGSRDKRGRGRARGIGRGFDIFQKMMQNSLPRAKM